MECKCYISDYLFPRYHVESWVMFFYGMQVLYQRLSISKIPCGIMGNVLHSCVGEILYSVCILTIHQTVPMNINGNKTQNEVKHLHTGNCCDSVWNTTDNKPIPSQRFKRNVSVLPNYFFKMPLSD